MAAEQDQKQVQQPARVWTPADIDRFTLKDRAELDRLILGTSASVKCRMPPRSALAVPKLGLKPSTSANTSNNKQSAASTTTAEWTTEWTFGDPPLPPELVLQIFAHLDFRSLCRVSQTSRGALLFIRYRYSPEYARVMEKAPELLAALAATRLLHLHSASTISDALATPWCSLCTINFGGFLFLPTCKRACFSCRAASHALRVIPPSEAERCFALTAEQAAALPVMTTVEGRYRAIGRPDVVPGTRLVAVVHAKRLAMRVHGAESTAELTAKLESLVTPTRTAEARRFHDFRAAPLSSPGADASRALQQEDLQEDPLPGVAFVRMPYVPSQELHRRPAAAAAAAADEGGAPGGDYGLLCMGCLKLPESVYSGLQRRLWRTDAFPEHLSNCSGVKAILAEDVARANAKARAEMAARLSASVSA